MLFSILIALLSSIQSLSGSLPISHASALTADLSDGNVLAGPVRNYSKQSLGVEITAKSAAVIDFSSSRYLYAKKIDIQLPIASLTKLMTALVFLDHNPGWQELVTMTPDDEVYRSKYIYRGEEVTVKDLFYISLIGSDNNATRAMVRSTGMTQDEFVAVMNAKAIELDMRQTSFFDVTGLDAKNISSIRDLMILASHIWVNKDILLATGSDDYRLTVNNTKSSRWIPSTNKLFSSFLEVSAGKTGFIDEAGYCLLTLVDDGKGNQIVVAVLGSQEEIDRFQDSKAMAWWAFANYIWK